VFCSKTSRSKESAPQLTTVRWSSVLLEWASITQINIFNNGEAPDGTQKNGG